MKVKKIFISSYLIIIYFFSLGIYYNFIYEHSARKNTNKKCSNYIDWEKEFPVSKQNKPNDKRKRNSFYLKIKKLISNIDSASRIYIPSRYTIIETSHIIDKITGKNIFPEIKDDKKLIRFNNGYFGFLTDKTDSYYEDGVKTVYFAKYLEKHNIKFAYILCPSKFSRDNIELPTGLKDCSNYNADSFLKPLYENNIKVLDFRDLLTKDYSSHFEAFYRTDHHWKPETGFWATNRILGFLNSNLNENFSTDIIKDINYDKKVYSKLLLGSQGKKVSLCLAEPEDFTLITPKFNTHFSIEAYCRDIKREGDFKTALLCPERLANDYYNIETLTTYLGVHSPVVRIKNHLTSNNKKIMIIKDSFVLHVTPFLACVTKEILLVERRIFPFYFNGSIKKLIEKEKPDIVLCLYYVGEFYPDNKDRFMMSDFE